MTEDLWYHALRFLDKYRTDVRQYDIDELYEFADKTGILERHKQLLAKPFHDSQVDMKIMYYELIKMLIDYERKNHPETYDATKTVGKIEGYQELTNKLQRYLNQRFIEDIDKLGEQQHNFTQINISQKFEEFETSLTSLNVSLSSLEQSHSSLQQSHTSLQESHSSLQESHSSLQQNHSSLQQNHTTLTQNYSLLENSHTELNKNYSQLNHQFVLLEKTNSSLLERVTNLEKSETSLYEEIRLLREKDVELEQRLYNQQEQHMAFQTAQVSTNEVTTSQLKVGVEETSRLSLRLDDLQSDFSPVKDHQSEQDIRISELESSSRSNDLKLTNLEAADTFLQESHRVLTERTQYFETEMKRIESNSHSFLEEQKQGFGKMLTGQIDSINLQLEKIDSDRSNMNIDFEKLTTKVNLNTERIDGLNNGIIETEKSLTVLFSDVNRLDTSYEHSKEKLAYCEDNIGSMSETIQEHSTAINQFSDMFKKINIQLLDFESGSKDSWQNIESRLAHQKIAIETMTEEFKMEQSTLRSVQDTLTTTVSNNQQLMNDVQENRVTIVQLQQDQVKVQDALKDHADITFQIQEGFSHLKIKAHENEKKASDFENALWDQNEVQKKQDQLMNQLIQDHKNLDVKHSESVEKLNQITVLTTNIQIQVKSQEEKMEKQQSADFSLISNRLKDVEIKQETGIQKMDEIDSKGKSLMTLLTTTEGNLNKEIDKLQESSEIFTNKLDVMSRSYDKKVKDLFEMDSEQADKIKVLEEASMLQSEKGKFIESLNTRVQQMDEARQQSEAKTRDDIDGSLSANENKLDELQRMMLNRMQEFENVINITTNKLDAEISPLKTQISNILSEKDILSQNQSNLEFKIDSHEGQIVNIQSDFGNKIDALNNAANNCHDKINKVEQDNRNNIEKLISMQEAAFTEKSKSVEVLTAKIHEIDEARQENEQKLAENNQKLIAENSKAISQLGIDLEKKLHELDSVRKEDIARVVNETDSLSKQISNIKVEQNESSITMDKLKDQNENIQLNSVKELREYRSTIETLLSGYQKQIECEVRDLDGKIDDSFKIMKNSIDTAISLNSTELHDKLMEKLDIGIQRATDQSKDTENHVNNLRELNSKLMDQVKEKIQGQEARQIDIANNLKIENQSLLNSFTNEYQEGLDALIKIKNEHTETISSISSTLLTLKEELTELEKRNGVDGSKIISLETSQAVQDKILDDLQENVQTIAHNVSNIEEKATLSYDDISDNMLKMKTSLTDSFKEEISTTVNHISLTIQEISSLNTKAEKQFNSVEENNKERFKILEDSQNKLAKMVENIQLDINEKIDSFNLSNNSRLSNAEENIKINNENISVNAGLIKNQSHEINNLISGNAELSDRIESLKKSLEDTQLMLEDLRSLKPIVEENTMHIEIFETERLVALEKSIKQEIHNNEQGIEAVRKDLAMLNSNLNENFKTSFDDINGKIITLQEATFVHAEKAQYLEVLSAKVNEVDQIQQQSAIKNKEDTDAIIKRNALEIEKIQTQFHEFQKNFEIQNEKEFSSVKEINETTKSQVLTILQRSSDQENEILIMLNDIHSMKDDLKASQTVIKAIENELVHSKDSVLQLKSEIKDFETKADQNDEKFEKIDNDLKNGIDAIRISVENASQNLNDEKLKEDQLREANKKLFDNIKKHLNELDDAMTLLTPDVKNNISRLDKLESENLSELLKQATQRIDEVTQNNVSISTELLSFKEDFKHQIHEIKSNVDLSKKRMDKFAENVDTNHDESLASLEEVKHLVSNMKQETKLSEENTERLLNEGLKKLQNDFQGSLIDCKDGIEKLNAKESNLRDQVAEVKELLVQYPNTVKTTTDELLSKIESLECSNQDDLSKLAKNVELVFEKIGEIEDLSNKNDSKYVNIDQFNAKFDEIAEFKTGIENHVETKFNEALASSKKLNTSTAEKMEIEFGLHDETWKNMFGSLSDKIDIANSKTQILQEGIESLNDGNEKLEQQVMVINKDIYPKFQNMFESIDEVDNRVKTMESEGIQDKVKSLQEIVNDNSEKILNLEVSAKKIMQLDELKLAFEEKSLLNSKEIVQNNRDQKEMIQNQLSEIQDVMDKKQNESLAIFNEQHETVNNQLILLMKQNSDRDICIANSTRDAQELKKQIEVLMEDTKVLENNGGKFESAIQIIQDKLNGISSDVQKHISENDKQQKLLEDLLKNMDDTHSEKIVALERTILHEKIPVLESKHETLTSALHELEVESPSILSEIEALKKDMADLARDQDLRNGETLLKIQDAHATSTNLFVNIKEVGENNRILQDDVEKVKAELTSLNSSLNDQFDNISSGEASLIEKYNKLEVQFSELPKNVEDSLSEINLKIQNLQTDSQDGDEKLGDYIEDLLDKFNSLKTSIDSFDNNYVSVINLDTRLHEILSSQNEARKQVENILNITSAQNNDMKNYVNEKFHSLSMQEQSDIENLNNDSLQLKASFNDLKIRVNTLEDQIIEYRERNGHISKSMEDMDVELKDKFGEILAFKSQIESRLGCFEENNRTVNEKLVSIQESTQIYAEKAQHVDILTAKINQVDEMRQKSEAKAKEDTNVALEKYVSDISTLHQELKNLDFSTDKKLMENYQKIYQDININQERTLVLENDGVAFKETLAKYQEMLEEKLKEVDKNSQQNSASLQMVQNNMDLAIAGVRDEQHLSVKKLESDLRENVNMITVNIKTDIDNVARSTGEQISSIQSQLDGLKDGSHQAKEKAEQQMDAIVEFKKESQDMLTVIRNEIESKLRKLEDDAQQQKTQIEFHSTFVNSSQELFNSLSIAGGKNEEKIRALEALSQNLDNKLGNLESADLFLQEAHRILTDKTSSVEAESKRVEDSLSSQIKDQQEEIESKLKVQITALLKDVHEIKLDNVKLFENIENFSQKSEENGQKLTALDNANQEKIKQFGMLLESSSQAIAEKMELDINLMKDKIKENTELGTQNQKSISDIMENLETSQVENSKQMKDIQQNADKIQDRIESLDVDIKEGHQVTEKIGNKIADIDRMNEVHDLRITELEKHILSIRQDIQALDIQHTETVNKVQEVTVLTSNIQVNVKAQEQKFEEQKALDMGDIHGKIEVVSAKIDSLNSVRAEITEKLSNLASELESYKNNSNKENGVMDVKISSNLSMINDIERSINDMNQKLKLFEERNKAQEQKIHVMEMLGDELSQLKDSHISDLERFNDQLTMVSAESKNHFMNGQNEMKQSIENLVSNNLLPLESALKSLQAEVLVVKDEQGAKEKKLSELDAQRLLTSKKVDENYIDLSMKHENVLHQISQIMEKSKAIEENSKDHQEKLVSLEEATFFHAEKAKYVDALSERFTRMDELRQQSESKSKEELAHTVAGNAKAIAELKLELSESLQKNLESLRLELENLREFTVKNSVQITETTESNVRNINNDIEKRIIAIHNHIEEHKSLIERTHTSVTKITERVVQAEKDQSQLTEKLSVESNGKLDAFQADIERKLQELYSVHAEHSSLLASTQITLEELQASSQGFLLNIGINEKEIINVKEKMEGERELVVFKMKEQKDSLESYFRTLESQVEHVQTTQITESSRMERMEKQLIVREQLTTDIAGKIEQLQRASDDHQAVLTSLQTSLTTQEQSLRADMLANRKTTKDDLKILRADTTTDRENLWTLILEIYSAFRGSTLVLKSEGAVADHQADVLGVYRMVDSYNDRPVYKQDGGENYIYYSAASASWLVGTVVGHQHGWLRNGTKAAGARRWIPDLRTGWEYRPLLRTSQHLANTWSSDDGTLRIESLRDVEKVNEVIRDITNSKEID